MGHSDYYRILDRGRKAGLNTSEIYAAMTGRQCGRHPLLTSQADTNGYVSDLDDQGKVVYQPLNSAQMSRREK